MTVADCFRTFGDISDEEIEYALWSETAYPFADIRLLFRQIKSYMRARNNEIKRCELCGFKEPFHMRGCLNKELPE